MQVAQKLGDDWYGWRAWAALLERFPDSEPSLIPEEAQTVSAANIQRLWQSFPQDVRAASLSLMIQRLWEFYGGAAPPGAQALDEAALPIEGELTGVQIDFPGQDDAAGEQASAAKPEMPAEAPAEDWSDAGDWGAGGDIAFAGPQEAEAEQDLAEGEEWSGTAAEVDLSDWDELLPPELMDELDEAEAEAEGSAQD